MALVSCRECAADISDSAATCPRCGVAAPAGMCSLTFVRAGVKNAAVPIGVFVDGNPYGVMKMRGRVSVPVAPGDHHVELRTPQGKSAVGNIRASGSETVLTVTMSMMGMPRIDS